MLINVNKLKKKQQKHKPTVKKVDEPKVDVVRKKKEQQEQDPIEEVKQDIKSKEEKITTK